MFSALQNPVTDICEYRERWGPRAKHIRLIKIDPLSPSQTDGKMPQGATVSVVANTDHVIGAKQLFDSVLVLITTGAPAS